jgi:transcriptional regulator with XRE-family HTH domain
MDCRGSVAAAGLDERAADRDARSAAAYRRALVHRGAREFGLSRRQLAAVTQVSRGRIDQILSEPVSSGSAAARDARSLDELLHRLEQAANAHRDAVDRLRAARHVRAQRVTQAREQGVSLAQIATCLGVTRGRVQQLAAR